MRADQLLVERGLAPTRSAAQRLIAHRRRALARADGLGACRRKAGEDVPDDADVEITDDAELRFVSRGGLKLDGALTRLGLDVAGLTCLDLGQSTGGFTDALLRAARARVVGIDVGHGQLHPPPRRRCARDRARGPERAGRRRLGPSCRFAQFDLVVGDLSFISLDARAADARARYSRRAAASCCSSSRSSSCSRSTSARAAWSRTRRAYGHVETDAAQGVRRARPGGARLVRQLRRGQRRQRASSSSCDARQRSDPHAMTHAPPRSVSFEFFPPNTPVGSEKLQSVAAELATRSKPEFSQRHLRRRRLDARRARWRRCSDHRRAGPGGGAAPVVRRLDPGRHLGDPRAPTARRRSAAWSRCAATCRAATATAGEFRYASDLISFIRATQGSDWFTSRSPPTRSTTRRSATPKRDLQHFAAKVKAGADSAITQFFFNPDAYFHFVDEVRALGVDVPIVPGIMPFHNYAKIAQFAARDGIEIPRWVALQDGRLHGRHRVDPRLRPRRRHPAVRSG